MKRTRKKILFHASKRALPAVRQAFTLVELLVVIAIIGLLSTVAVVALNSSRMKARNAQRKANLVQLSKALEVYYSDNGSYPSTGGATFSECSCEGGWVVKGNSGANGWIPNLAPTYMSQLPHDPHSGLANPSSSQNECRVYPSCNCYFYISNGNSYSVDAECVPEGPIPTTDPFYNPGSIGSYRLNSP